MSALLSSPVRHDREPDRADVAPLASRCGRARGSARRRVHGAPLRASRRGRASRGARAGRPTAEPGPDGPPGRSQTTTSKPSRSSGSARSVAKRMRPMALPPHGSTVIAGECVRPSRPIGGASAAGEVLEDRAADRQTSGDVQGERIGVDQTHPSRHRAVSRQRGRDVRRYASLALGIFGRRHTDGKGRHKGFLGSYWCVTQQRLRAVKHVTGPRPSERAMAAR